MKTPITGKPFTNPTLTPQSCYAIMQCLIGREKLRLARQKKEMDIRFFLRGLSNNRKQIIAICAMYDMTATIEERIVIR
jgi:hypothetical protein